MEGLKYTPLSKQRKIMIDKIKEKIKCLPDDAKHLWMFHRKTCIAAGVVIVILIIII